MLTVMLPGLIWPNTADLDYLQIKTPNLDKLIKRSTLTREHYYLSDFIYANSAPSSAHSMATQAAISLNISHEYKHFLFAEPTHLRVDRDRLLISESELLQLDNTEISKIIDILNQHFSPDIKFYQFKPELWLIGVNFVLPNSRFYPIIDIIGENIDDYLPTGTNSIKLAQIFNEVQMLLFKSPENLKRQQDKLLTLNSLWFWDKNIDQAKQHLIYQQIFTNCKYIQQSRVQKIPKDITTLLRLQDLESSLIFIDTLYYSACYRDSYLWTNYIEKIDHELFASLLHYKKPLNLLIPSTNKTFKITISKVNTYKIWRKPLALNKSRKK